MDDFPSGVEKAVGAVEPGIAIENVDADQDDVVVLDDEYDGSDADMDESLLELWKEGESSLNEIPRIFEVDDDSYPLAVPLVVADLMDSMDEELDKMEEGDEEEPINPFLLPEIVSNVLRFVEYEETLLTCREVSRMWRAEATAIIRKRYTITLNTVKEITDYCSSMELSEDLLHESFFLNLKLSELDDPSAKALNEFITTYGPVLKHLKLSLNERIFDPATWWTLLYNCYGLEKLSVSINRDFATLFEPGDGGLTLFEKKAKREFGVPHVPLTTELAQSRNEMPLPIRASDEIFNVSPALHGPIAPKLQLKVKHFEVTFEGANGSAEAVSNFFKTIFSECESSLVSVSTSSLHTDIHLGNILYTCLVDLDKRFLKLKNFNFWLKPTNNQLKDLIKFTGLNNIKLILGSDIRNDGFQKAISGTASSIQRLELIVQTPSLLVGAFPVPVRMQQLKYLKLFVHNGKGCLDFLGNAPALEELRVLGVDLKLIVNEVPQHRPNTALKSLQILRANGEMAIPEIISGVKHGFSEVVRLDISHVTNETLDMIYQTMPNLQELKIMGTFTDEGIAGIPETTCDEIKELQAHFIADDEKLRQYIFIGCLAKLRRLTIGSDSMTDISVMFGLTRLKKLEHLVIFGELITEKSAEAIYNFMTLETLDVSGCKNLAEAFLSKSTMQAWWSEMIDRKDESLHEENEAVDKLLKFEHIRLEDARRDRDVPARMAQIRANIANRAPNLFDNPNRNEAGIQDPIDDPPMGPEFMILNFPMDDPDNNMDIFMPM